MAQKNSTNYLLTVWPPLFDAAIDPLRAGIGVQPKLHIIMNATKTSTGEPCLVSMKGVIAMTSLSRTMLNRYRSEGRFPAAVPLGEKRVAFVKSEVIEWIANRIEARGANDNKPQAGREAA